MFRRLRLSPDPADIVPEAPPAPAAIDHTDIDEAHGEWIRLAHWIEQLATRAADRPLTPAEQQGLRVSALVVGGMAEKIRETRILGRVLRQATESRA
jgi:hypothetical protein